MEEEPILTTIFLVAKLEKHVLVSCFVMPVLSIHASLVNSRVPSLIISVIAAAAALMALERLRHISIQLLLKRIGIQQSEAEDGAGFRTMRRAFMTLLYPYRDPDRMF